MPICLCIYLIDILLQLKRTVEVVSVLDNTNNDKASDMKREADDAKRISGQGRIKTLLDGALSAGKAARNEDIVPEIIKLKEYGSDGTPPSALANTVSEVRYFCIRIIRCGLSPAFSHTY